MSDPISAIGANTQASPAPQVYSQAQSSTEKPRTSTGPDAASPKKSDGAASQQAQLLSADKTDVTGGAAQKTEPNGATANGQQGDDGKAQQESQPLSKEETQKAMESFMAYVEKLPGEMKFTVDKDTNRQVFKIVNPVTNEVVKQFPPDEFLTMIKRLKQLDSPSKDNGIFLDEKS